MQYIPVYARRKAGQEPVTYIDPRLEAITGDTYGISIYQEQSMEIAKQIGGFSPADADDLRKAIGKKIHSLMASLKEQFIEGCVANGTTKEVAKQLWDDMEKAQDYSFNKSHAAGYALIAYRTAWLRAHHAHEYMAALISSVMRPRTASRSTSTRATRWASTSCLRTSTSPRSTSPSSRARSASA